jgi:GxxExxY protein
MDTARIINAAIEVHKNLGPGLLESAYEMCLAKELETQEIHFERQKPVPLQYKGIQLEAGDRIDFLIENELIVEIKAVETISPLAIAQVLTYLRLLGCHTGLIFNFNVPLLKDGIRRVSL